MDRVLARAASRAWVRHLTLILAYQAAGIAATWPLASYLLAGNLPATLDVAGYDWGLWWVARHLFSPGQLLFTTGMAAPAGVHLGFSTIMPLAGILMAPVTLTAGPGAALMLLGTITPGLLCYAMFRAARLWLNAPGAIAAGAFFGLSSALAWRDWYHLNVAIGTLFLPLAVEAAIRLRRDHRDKWAGAGLGAVLGGSAMINQQSFIVALILAGAITLRWVLPLFIRDAGKLYDLMPPLLIAAGTAAIVGGLQFAEMARQLMAGAATSPIGLLAQDWVNYGATLPSLFGPSPRLAEHGLGVLSSHYTNSHWGEGIASYGIVLTVLALLGIAVGWRHRATWWFAGLWLVSSALALGTSIVFATGSNCTFSTMYQGVQSGPDCRQYLPFAGYLHWVYVPVPGQAAIWRPAVVSNLMPYSWLVRLPLLSGLREADRFMFVGLVGAALLAGLAVQQLSRLRRTARLSRRLAVPLAVPFLTAVAVLGWLESGWSAAATPTMPDTVPQVGQALAADGNSGIVVDLPFGLRGGSPILGQKVEPWELTTATIDGHPRAISYTAWIPVTTSQTIKHHPFYRMLLDTEAIGGRPYRSLTSAQLKRAKADYRKMKIGRVVFWLGDSAGGVIPGSPDSSWPRYLSAPSYWYQNVAGYLRAIGLRQTQLICIAAPAAGTTGTTGTSCPLPDQVWIWK